MWAILAQTTVGSLLEAAMLICFGVSWPVSLVKTLRVKKVTGKSLVFLALVFVGYLCGIAAKIDRAIDTGKPIEWVTSLYAMNALLVAVDTVLYVRYSRREARASEADAQG